MSRSQYTYYVIILGGGRGQGNDYLDYAGGVQNWAKVDYIICAHSLRSILYFPGWVVIIRIKANLSSNWTGLGLDWN